MLPLKYPLVWVIPGWLLLACVAYESLSSSTVVDIAANDKLAHFAAYFALMLWFAGFYPRRAYAAIAIVLVVVGALLDVLQLGTSTRQFDLYDILANTLGVLAGYVLAVFALGGWCQRVEQRLLR